MNVSFGRREESSRYPTKSVQKDRNVFFLGIIFATYTLQSMGDRQPQQGQRDTQRHLARKSVLEGWLLIDGPFSPKLGRDTSWAKTAHIGALALLARKHRVSLYEAAGGLILDLEDLEQLCR